MSEGRILGVDYGDRRVGIALSDPTGFLASGHSVIVVQGPAHAVNEVTKVVRDSKCIRVVVGLPLNMDGSKGPSAQKALAFVEALKEKVAVPVVTWDERLSTKAAHDILQTAGHKAKDRKGIVDKVAAEVLLQAYLDAQPSTQP